MPNYTLPALTALLAKRFHVKQSQVEIKGQHVIIAGKTKGGYKVIYRPDGMYALKQDFV